MDLLNTLRLNKKNKGFTLVEIIIALGLMSIVVALGLFASFDLFRGSSLASERDVIVSILQRARSESLNNINQTRHGVHFTGVKPNLKYVLFECNPAPQCSSYTPSSADATTTSSYGFSITTPADIIFAQLTGTSTDATITMADGRSTSTITINSEGRINW